MITPLRAFRVVAIAEAVTWAGLLTGMFLKYVADVTEVGVQVFGMLHGVVFVAYVVVVLVVAVDRGWSVGRSLLGLAASVPPFATVLLDRVAERRGWLGAADDSWRIGVLRRHPAACVAAALVTVGVLTTLALAIGPP